MSEKLNKWLELLKAAEKTCIISDGKKNQNTPKQFSLI